MSEEMGTSENDGKSVKGRRDERGGVEGASERERERERERGPSQWPRRLRGR